MLEIPEIDELDHAVEKYIHCSDTTRAPIRYVGGKGDLAQWIAQFIPNDSAVYVEPYCGAAGVFWHRPPAKLEVLNDLDGDVVNLFRVLQDPALFAEFRHRILWTPYSRAEFARALAYDGSDPVMRAWAFYTLKNQAFAACVATCVSNWGRTIQPNASGALSWHSRKAMLVAWHRRLASVQLEQRDALDVIRTWDSPDTAFYIDPPYIQRTRRDPVTYRHEVGDDHHRSLVDLLLQIQGCAVLSGYRDPIYDPLEQAGWIRYDREVFVRAEPSHRVRAVESLWVSPTCQKRAAQGTLF